ncbi:MAG TPA: ornithine cyclodeaminase [Streptosporangiaceae bacterium]
MPYLSDESDTQFRYLSARDVAGLCAPDVVLSAAEQALRLHSLGRTILPSESYLAWQAPSGAGARCLAMPGALSTDEGLIVGLKTINASLANTSSGRKRSDGFTILLDPETARPIAVLQAAHMSAQRTAAVSAIGARLLAPAATTLGIVGCGTLGVAHAVLLGHALPGVSAIRLFDVLRPQADELARYLGEEFPGRFALTVAPTAESCVRESNVVVLATTTSKAYVPYHWISPGTFISNVSLDDLFPEVFQRCDYLVVDDWSLVCDDERRMLGRLARAGLVGGPGGQPGQSGEHGAAPAPRAVDATLGQLLTGERPGPQSRDAVAVCNPFGMAILDVALAYSVVAAAEAAGTGIMLPL